MSFDPTNHNELTVTKSPIPGLVVITLPVHGDARGWFKENWQREKMTTLGLPDFGPVQNNISFNAERGVTRGLHAEPWDKYISVAAGKVFGAWVDLREGESFGKTFSIEITPGVAVYVPAGVANGFQALEENTAYTYLVNDHWSADAEYTFVNLRDETAAIPWPIAIDDAIISEKDEHHPHLSDAIPFTGKKTLVLGCNGQLGSELRRVFPKADFVDREDFDICDPQAYEAVQWNTYDTVINAAAMTNVDGAETPDGRSLAWKVNAYAPSLLAKTATKHRLTLVHVSSDYVFDGTKESYTENEPFAPLSVYGASKAAGDIAISTAPKHYVVRTSWVIGNGKNFVDTMAMLADKEIKPSVVNDQIGRLTFTSTLADAIKHLVDTTPEYGTYNITSSGDSQSWADYAKVIFELKSKSADNVTPTTTTEYFAGKENIAPRPTHSTLSLEKIEKTGFTCPNWQELLEKHLKSE